MTERHVLLTPSVIYCNTARGHAKALTFVASRISIVTEPLVSTTTPPYVHHAIIRTNTPSMLSYSLLCITIPSQVPVFRVSLKTPFFYRSCQPAKPLSPLLLNTTKGNTQYTPRGNGLLSRVPSEIFLPYPFLLVDLCAARRFCHDLSIKNLQLDTRGMVLALRPIILRQVVPDRRLVTTDSSG